MKKRNIEYFPVKKAQLVLWFVVMGCILCLYPQQASTAADEGVQFLQSHGLVGVKLQMMVKARAEGIMAVNRPYLGNGIIDCYGYVRQIWNPIIASGSHHPEDFKTASYTQSVMVTRINQARGLPVNDCSSPKWAPITNLDQLKIGDIVGTVRGHRWGMDVHYGLYAGKIGSTHYQYDCSGSGGAYKRTWWSGFKYYYAPTHILLMMGNDNQSSTGSQLGHWKLL